MFGDVEYHDDCISQHQLRFLKAVDQSLRPFTGQKVPDFILTCCLGKEFAYDFNRWMQSVATLGVEDLLINFCSPIHVDTYRSSRLIGFFPFPFEQLFEVASLTNLHLLACALRPIFKGQFKSLQSLTLCMVPLDNGQLASILSSCPNLQGIRVAYCRLPSKLCISGQCLQLKFLFIESCHGVKEIDICAGNLTMFYCHTDEMIKYSLHFVPKLENLIVSFNGSCTVPYLFGEAAKDCTQLKHLMFETKTDELQYIPAKMDMFSNLRILYLLMMFNSKVDLLNVSPILNACPLLEHFYLLARCSVRNEQSGRPWPVRHHTQLKEVEFDGFCGTRNEIEFASFLLQSSSALEQLWIRLSYSTYSADFKWTEHTDYVIDEEERQSMYKQLVGQALSSKVKVIIL